MVYIYNESKTPWDVVWSNNHARIETVKQVKHRENNTVKTKVVGVKYFGTPLFEPIDVTALVQTPKPVKISDSVSNILIHHKDRKPFLTTDHKYSKSIIAFTINLAGGVVTDISNEGSFILDFGINNGELSMVVGLSENSSSKNEFYIVTRNNRTKQRTKHLFFVSNGTFNVTQIINPIDDDTPEEKFYNISRFNPPTPNHLIFVHKRDISKFAELVEKNPGMPSHSVVIFSHKDELISLVKMYKNDSFKAATLFIARPTLDIANLGIYGNNNDILSSHFRIYNRLLSTGKIE